MLGPFVSATQQQLSLQNNEKKKTSAVGESHFINNENKRSNLGGNGENNLGISGICHQTLHHNSFECIIIRQYNKLSNLCSIISAYNAVTGATEKWMDSQTAS